MYKDGHYSILVNCLLQVTMNIFKEADLPAVKSAHHGTNNDFPNGAFRGMQAKHVIMLQIHLENHDSRAVDFKIKENWCIALNTKNPNVHIDNKS